MEHNFLNDKTVFKSMILKKFADVGIPKTPIPPSRVGKRRQWGHTPPPPKMPTS